MPKTDIDYSNTIIYKITCLDPTITDVYVGHTTNFVQRKHAHKQSCNNEKTKNYKCKLYEIIRNNGGWKNWHMEIINFFNCRDHYEARKKEQEFFISLNATLNSIEPFPKPKIYNDVVINNDCIKKEIYCEKCKKYFNSAKLLEIHNNTKKHKKFMIKQQICDIFINKHLCKECDYKTGKKSSFDKHLTSRKHLCNKERNICNDKVVNSRIFVCQFCKKIYKHASTLSSHKKICSTKEVNIENVIIDNYPSENTVLDTCSNEIKLLTNLVLEFVKSNTELQKQNHTLQQQMLDVIQKIQPGVIKNNF